MTKRTAPADQLPLGARWVRAGLAARARRLGYAAQGRAVYLRTSATVDQVLVVEVFGGYRLGHGRRGAKLLVGPAADHVYATRAEAAAALPVVAMVHDERTRTYPTIAARRAARLDAIGTAAASRLAASSPAAPVDVTHLVEDRPDRATDRQIAYARRLLGRRLRSGWEGGYESTLPTMTSLERMSRSTISYWITYLSDDVA